MNRRTVVNGWAVVRNGMSITGPRIQRYSVYSMLNLRMRGSWVATFMSEADALEFCNANVGPII